MPRVARLAGAIVAVVLLLLTIAPAHAADTDTRSARAARELVTAVLDRIALAIPVAAAKRVSGAAVDDPVREAQAADAFVVLLVPLAIDATFGREVITAQFAASTSVQRALLAQWQARPDTIPPGEPPDLVTQVRPAIDAATTELVSALDAACRAYRAHPAGWTRALADAAAGQRPRWRWERRALALALDPLREHPCPREARTPVV